MRTDGEMTASIHSAAIRGTLRRRSRTRYAWRSAPGAAPPGSRIHRSTARPHQRVRAHNRPTVAVTALDRSAESLRVLEIPTAIAFDLARAHAGDRAGAGPAGSMDRHQRCSRRTPRRPAAGRAPWPSPRRGPGSCANTSKAGRPASMPRFNRRASPERMCSSRQRYIAR